mmetsp:Transcript_32794/g.83798  ORF Transcript_32794/g.83798 Transcript_32794/m.83798 type:complete len:100 (-) Transcript_32794:68-367(-)
MGDAAGGRSERTIRLELPEEESGSSGSSLSLGARRQTLSRTSHLQDETTAVPVMPATSRRAPAGSNRWAVAGQSFVHDENLLDCDEVVDLLSVRWMGST